MWVPERKKGQFHVGAGTGERRPTKTEITWERKEKAANNGET